MGRVISLTDSSINLNGRVISLTGAGIKLNDRGDLVIRWRDFDDIHSVQMDAQGS